VKQKSVAVLAACCICTVLAGIAALWAFRGNAPSEPAPAPPVPVAPVSKPVALTEVPDEVVRAPIVPPVPSDPEPDPPGLVISGIVVTAGEEPGAGAVVAAYTADTGAIRATAGEAGAFRIVGLREGAYRVSAVLDHYNEAVVEDVPAGTSDVRLVLQPLSAVEGRVVEATTGKPPAEFDVLYLQIPPGDGRHWQNIIRGETTPWQAQHSDDGRYRIEDVASGAVFAVGARAPGLEPAYVQVDALESGETGHAPDILLQPEARILGRVASADGSPVSGAEIYLGHEARGRTAARSDPDGRFTLGQLAAGQVQITASHRDYLPATVEAEAARGRDTEVEIVLGGGGLVEGYVTNGSEPLGGETVSAGRLVPPRIRKQAITDDSGHYTISGLPPGEVEVIVKVQAEPDTKPVRMQKQATVADGLTTVVDFDFGLASCAVEGYVTVGGQPRQHAEIKGFVTGEGGDSFFHAYSREDGFYTVENVAPGSAWLEITVLVDGREQRNNIPVEIPPQGRVRQDVDFGGTAVITGAVSGFADGEGGEVLALEGAVDVNAPDFDIMNMQRIQVASSPIESEGSFVLRNLDEGAYTIVAIVFNPNEGHEAGGLPPFTLVSQQIQLVAGQHAQVSLIIP